ncbi:MAG: hypothetical protein LUG52_08105, partial [Clostridia bacterium]|nr:hypothetical protein [Clostridia bacterium]
GVGSDSGNPAFSAYNWGSSVDSPDRVGFAIVTVPDDEVSATQYYELTATRLRAYSDSNCNLNTYFYIVSIDDYNSLDVSDNDAIADLYANATCIATYNKTDYNDDDKTSTEVSFVLDTEDILQYAGETVVIIGTSTIGLYGLSSDIAIGVSDKDYGVDLYAGAQIRVGDGMDDDSESETYQELLGDSGLRFIAVVDKENTMAAVATEIGIAIFDGGFDTTAVTAESAKQAFDGTDPVTTITDDTYQDINETVFTAAITNIKESNYNRIYVAVPYVVVGGNTYYNWDATVARTPYQVASGILLSGSETEGDYSETATGDALTNVLNVYTNKTGARVEIADNNRSSLAAVTYANGAEAFFEITSETDSSDNYVFTLTPTDGSSAVFYDYAVDYFRINNASASTFESAISGANVELVNGNIVITVPASTTSGDGDNDVDAGDE